MLDPERVLLVLGIVDRKDLETCVGTELRLLARDAYTGVLAVSLFGHPSADR